ncbi:hypothetical protein ACF1AE_21420 [Streptomyces sp. NPDC014986]|uniref:hypothetical protein n=1 Tax=Streptomyces sp. NPDC014986 TaxID=3364934 RepID=UPI0036F849E0
MIEPSETGSWGVQEPADLLDELDSEDWKRAGSTADPSTGRSGTRVHSPAPANNTVLDHLSACDGEVASFIAAARQAPVPPPAGPGQPGRAGAYERARVQAEHLGMDWQAYLEAMEWRHAVSSALLMGDKDAIRPEPCPACRTWGLVWVTTHKAAMCVNRYCAVGERPRMWTLAQLAAERAERRLQQVAN